MKLAETFLPAALRSRGVVEVNLDPASEARLVGLRGESVLICPNHPSNTEPAVLFELARRARLDWHYVCTREAFEYSWGIWGWLLQRWGAYSIERAALDRPSFQMTRSILARPGGQIVIFPEGEVNSQNDTLLPFQDGVLQLGFWGQEDLRKTHANGRVLVVPVALRYRYLQDMTKEIEHSLEAMERLCGLPKVEDNPYGRMRRLGTHIVSTCERHYGIAQIEGTPLNDRIEALKRVLLERAAAGAGVRLNSAEMPEQMRALINHVHRVTAEESAPKTGYDMRLWDESRVLVRQTLFQLKRLSNWIAVHDNYVAAEPTQERAIHTLRRMETEVFGRPTLSGPMACDVSVGEPVDLSQQLEPYAANRKQTVAAVTNEVEAAVQRQLNDLAQRHASPRLSVEPNDFL